MSSRVQCPECGHVARRGRVVAPHFKKGSKCQDCPGSNATPASRRLPDAPPPAVPLSLMVKLGSIAVHADEMLSLDGHAFDRTALEALLRDPEVVAWVRSMGALLPLKRKEG